MPRYGNVTSNSPRGVDAAPVLTLTLGRSLWASRAPERRQMSRGGDVQVSKKLRLSAVGAALALGLVACGGSGAGGSSGSSDNSNPKDVTIGVSMPTQTSERWIADGNNVKKQLEDKG